MNTQRVKMIKTLAGPKGSKTSGQILVLPEEEAKGLIAAKVAILAPMQEKKEKAVDHTVADRERAVAPDERPQDEPEKPQEESQEPQDEAEESAASGHASLPQKKAKAKKGKGKKGA